MRGDRTSIDHRIAWAPGAEFEGDLVECLPGWFDINPGQDRVHAAIGKGKCVGERLGDRLDREFHIDVADGVDLAVNGGEGRTEALRVRCFELGNVACERSGHVRRNVSEGLALDVGLALVLRIGESHLVCRERSTGFGLERT